MPTSLVPRTLDRCADPAFHVERRFSDPSGCPRAPALQTTALKGRRCGYLRRGALERRTFAWWACRAVGPPRVSRSCTQRVGPWFPDERPLCPYRDAKVGWLVTHRAPREWVLPGPSCAAFDAEVARWSQRVGEGAGTPLGTAPVSVALDSDSVGRRGSGGGCRSCGHRRVPTTSCVQPVPGAPSRAEPWSRAARIVSTSRRCPFEGPGALQSVLLRSQTAVATGP